jgi:glc operon protein GlcG
MRKKMPLALEDAQRILRAAEASAKENGINVSISIVDARGDLVASIRMDGARFFTADVSRGKAVASAVFAQPSGALTERSNTPVFQSLNLMQQGRFIFGQGALPISRGGTVEGAIGVSGGTSQQDEDIANAGLSAL